MTYEYEDKSIHTDKSIRIQKLSWCDNGYHELYGDPAHGWYLDLSFSILDGIVI